MLTKLAVGLAVQGAAAAAVPTNRRSLSTVPILTYYPGSGVTDHNRIDIDQAALEAAMTDCGAGATTNGDGCAAGALGADGLVEGIYKNGGGSGPQAICQITTAGGVVAGGFSKKDVAVYTNSAGISGTKKTSAGADAEDTEIKIYYATSSDKDHSATTCVGEKVRPYLSSTDYADPAVDFTTPTSCMDSGTIAVTTSDAGAGDVTTTYTVTNCTNVQSTRTLQGFSTKAKKLMYTPATSGAPPAKSETGGYLSGVPYTSYEPYFDYYCEDRADGTSPGCQTDGGYADNIVMAAITGGATDLARANIDFGTAAGQASQNVIKKATAYMNAWMYAIREFEDAIDDCTGAALTDNELSSDDAVHAWDEGVAFYVGSLHGAWGPDYSGSGKLAYDLGNKRCKNFMTCGENGDEATGQSQQNYKLFQLFNEGQVDFRLGNCAPVVAVKNKIIQWMAIPLVQGTLRYAFETGPLEGTLKGKAEGAIFALAVLPQVHDCDPAAAAVIEAEMIGKFHSGRANFVAVREAFESCYSAMFPSIDGCAAIGTYGGSDGSNDYSEYGTTPGCGDASASSSSSELSSGALIAIIICGALAGLLFLCLMYVYCSEKSSGKPMFYNLKAGGKGGSA